MIGYVIKCKKNIEDDSKDKYLIHKNDRWCWGESIELANVFYTLEYINDLFQWLISQDKYKEYKDMIQEENIYISEIELSYTEKRLYFAMVGEEYGI